MFNGYINDLDGHVATRWKSYCTESNVVEKEIWLLVNHECRYIVNMDPQDLGLEICFFCIWKWGPQIWVPSVKLWAIQSFLGCFLWPISFGPEFPRETRFLGAPSKMAIGPWTQWLMQLQLRNPNFPKKRRGQHTRSHKNWYAYSELFPKEIQ